MESVLYFKNHNIMPDTVLYICYNTVFIFFFWGGGFWGFLPYADTIHMYWSRHSKITYSKLANSYAICKHNCHVDLVI